jgi:anti-sigma B factor antagonist
MDFKLSTSTIDDGGASRIAVCGELDIATAKQLAEPVAVALSAGGHVVLDLSECEFIDSSGLRWILRAQHALAEGGKALVLVTDRPQIREVLALTAIDLRARVFSHLDEALDWLAHDATAVPDAPQWPLPTVGGPSPAAPGH